MENTKSIIQECMTTDKKPLVSILLAAYKPNEKWFKEQLQSLNAQTYDNKELIIYNDCPDCPLDEQLIKTTITFPYRIFNGKKNLGFL